MFRGTVNIKLFGRRFFARGSIQSGRCGSLSDAILASTVAIRNDTHFPAQ
jgi:hypothetical protein